MKIIFILLSLFSALISCHDKGPGPSTTKQEISIRDADSANAGPQKELSFDPAHLGELIGTVEFGVKVKKSVKGKIEDEIRHYISLEDPTAEMDGLINPDESVLLQKAVTLILDYPLEKTAVFKLKSNGEGFSRRELITLISEKYHIIYKEEEETSNVKVIDRNKREGTINRNVTKGKYGIWGHDLSDLVLSSIDVYRNKDGTVYLSLGIES